MSRTPHGVRELKPVLSHSTRRAGLGRTPHGVRELKLDWEGKTKKIKRRTPHGVRELKHAYAAPHEDLPLSHPTRGA